MRRRFRAVLWSVSIFVIEALRCLPTSAGSVCSRLPFHEDFARSPAIFVGTPLKKEVLFDTCDWAFRSLPKGDALFEKWEGRSVRVTLRVDESFKRPPEGGLVQVLTPGPCTEGTVGFEFGRQYLVYTVREDSEGVAETEEIGRIEICSRTERIEYSQRDLYYLRQIKSEPDSGGTVFGRLEDEEGILDQLPELILASERGSRGVSVGKSGEIHLTNLQPGNYQLIVRLPPAVDPDPIILGFAIRNLASVVELPLVVLRRAGRVEGRLIQPNGKPAFGFQVTGRGVARSDRDGRFVLRHIRAGKAFSVSVCVPGSEQSSGEAGKECTYFPGVRDLSNSESVTLKPGQILNLPDLPIPWVSRPCDLAGTVLTTDGERAAGTQIVDYLSQKVSEPPRTTDSVGSFAYRCSLHEPHNLSFCYETEKYGRRVVYSGKARIEAGTCPAEPLTVELSPAAACGGAHLQAPYPSWAIPSN